MKTALLFLLTLFCIPVIAQDRPRDLGITIGILPTGPNNAITDVKDVRVGHTTLISGENVRTGVTAIIPHSGNVFMDKVPAAIHIGNGFGKLAGYSQVRELGNIETPIILTNTLGVPAASEALVRYTLNQDGNEEVRSVNPVVGETNDGYLNDIRGIHVKTDHVLEAIERASSGPVEEGNTGAGTGTVCFGFKGGIGTASRLLPETLGGYTVGVLVQTNFGGVLEIAGVPVGVELEQYPFRNALQKSDGSCMIVVATDAPLSARNLERLAKRAIMGLAKTGGIASNGSGDYVIAFSTTPGNRVPYQAEQSVMNTESLHNDRMSPLFMAVIEATEEAIINSLFAAGTMVGHEGHTVERLPVEKVLEILDRYNRLKKED